MFHFNASMRDTRTLGQRSICYRAEGCCVPLRGVGQGSWWRIQPSKWCVRPVRYSDSVQAKVNYSSIPVQILVKQVIDNVTIKLTYIALFVVCICIIMLL